MHRLYSAEVALTPNFLENTITSAQGAQEQGTKVVSMIKTGLEAAGSLEVVTTNLNSLMEGSNLLMKALDDVAKIHPFIGGIYYFYFYNDCSDASR